MPFSEEWLQEVLSRGQVRVLSDGQGRTHEEAQEGYQNVQQDSQAGGEPERRFMERIRALARDTGWHVYHTHDSRRSEAGFPDLVLTDGVSLMVAEVKRQTGKLTPAQQIWLSLLEHAGVEVHVWRPSDWESIATRLRRRRWAEQ